MGHFAMLRNGLRIFGKSLAAHDNRNLYIHHHLGLGDMIHCNGLVRHMLEGLPEDLSVRVFCKQSYAPMVEWMYRDQPRIELRCIDQTKHESREVQRVLRREGVSNFLSIGHRPMRKLASKHPDLFCDQLFYLQVGLPYEYRFSKCYWLRDKQEEERVFRKLAPAGDYAFVHDDPSRGFELNADEIDLPIVRNDVSESIFHFGLVLERAKQIHCMESSMRCMIESLNVSGVELFWHAFRKENRTLGTATCQNWQEVCYEKAA